MTLPQHLVPDLASATAGSTVVVDGDEGHHAVVVRRMRVGEPVMLSDGRGRVATGKVVATGKRSMDVEVGDVVDHPEPRPRIVTVQALPKGDRGELATEVLTEVGVAAVVPWGAERSQAVWKGERAAKSLARWRSTAREAAKQSRRAWHPEVRELATTDDVAALVAEFVAGGGAVVVLHEAAGEPLAAVPVPVVGDLAVVVGPEGGLTEVEVERFVAAGAVCVRLGDEVLRTSTAGVVAVAALLARTPRWGG